MPQGSGHVISLSSGAGKRGRAGRASYGAAKAAIINLTESMALENVQYGITVNCICPGAVAGDRALNIFRQFAEAQGRSSEEGETEYRKAGRPLRHGGSRSPDSQSSCARQKDRGSTDRRSASAEAPTRYACRPFCDEDLTASRM